MILFLVENLIIAEISRENDLRLCGLDVVCLNRIQIGFISLRLCLTYHNVFI